MNKYIEASQTSKEADSMDDNENGVYLKSEEDVNEKSKPSPKPATQPQKQPKEAPATKRFTEVPVRKAAPLEKSADPKDPERP